MFLTFSVGKWLQEVSNQLYKKISERTEKPTYHNKIKFCTDGNEQNIKAIKKYFLKETAWYGQVIKDKQNNRVIGKHSRWVIGAIPLKEISIAHVDGLCSALRERVKCFVREAKTFPKKRRTIKDMLAVYQTYHNLIKAVERKTPCMREGITHCVWTWGKLLNAKISVVR